MPNYRLVYPCGGSNVTINFPSTSGTLQLAGAGGITGFTSQISTAAPNATVNVSQLLVDVSTTNGDVALEPKGNGAILAQIPTGTSAGGNKRGQYSVDLQRVRSDAARVASGNYSAVLSGQNNGAFQTESIVVGGNGNQVNASSAVIGGGQVNTITFNGSYGGIGSGYGNNVSQISGCISGGYTNTVSGQYAYVGAGLSNTANGQYCVVGGGQANTAGGSSHCVVGGGISNTSSGQQSVVSGGSGNIAQNLYSVVSGGASNTCSGSVCNIAGGQSNNILNTAGYACIGGGSANQIQAGNYTSVVGGNNNVAQNGTSYSSILGGRDNIIGGAQYAFVYGNACTVNHNFGIATGQQTITTKLYQKAWASGRMYANGDTQQTDEHFYRVTTDATLTTLTAGNQALGVATSLAVPLGGAMTYKILVSCKRFSSSDLGSWEITGCAINNGGVITLYNNTVNLIHKSIGSYDVTTAADSTNDSVNINVTGAVGHTILWTAYAYTIRSVLA